MSNPLYIEWRVEPNHLDVTLLITLRNFYKRIFLHIEHVLASRFIHTQSVWQSGHSASWNNVGRASDSIDTTS